MKKLLGIGLLVCITFLLVGCGNRAELSSQQLQQGAEVLAQAKQAADSGDWVLSESRLREVLALFPTAGYENERISALKVLVSVLKKQEKYDEAMEIMGKQRELLLSQKDKVGAANVLNEMGVMSGERKMYDKAMELYQQCYAEFEAMGHENAIAIKNNMADIKRLEGKYEEALALLAEIKPQAAEKNMTEVEGFITLTEGEVLEAQGKMSEAKKNYEVAQDLFKVAKSGALELVQEKISSMEPAPECFVNATWKSGACACNDGFGISLNKKSCVKIPENAHYMESPTDVWFCNEGFKEIANKCVTEK
jgi:tetratricopeptide (TPR) repeat protein